MKKKMLTSLGGIIVAFIAGLIILQIQGYAAGKSFLSIFDYSLFKPSAFFNSLFKATPLILTGLSASIAFGSNVINLGQVGQFLMGAMAVTVVGQVVDLPPVLMIPLLIAVATLGGALWAALAGFFRIRFGMDEFITTLMLNFIAKYFTDYLITDPLRDPELYSAMSRPIASSAWIASPGGFPLIFLLTMFLFLILLFYWHKTKTGYEMKIMGLNGLFSRTGGCKNTKNFYTAFIISGALAGLAGAFLVMGGQQHRFLKGFEANYGWDGVMIAIVAGASIGATGLYALFFAALQTGALGMELETSVPSEFVLVFQAIIVLFVVATRESAHVFVDKIHAAIQARRIGSHSESYSGTSPPVHGESQ